MFVAPERNRTVGERGEEQTKKKASDREGHDTLEEKNS